MTPRTFHAILALDMKNMFFDRMATGFLLVIPLGLYVFFGAFFGANASAESAARYYDSNTVGVAAITLLNVAFLNLGPTIAMARDGGFLRRLMLTPLTFTELWLSSLIRTVAIFAISYAGLLTMGYLFLGQVPHAGPLQIIVPALVGAFAMLSIGFLLGAVFDKPQMAFNGGMLLIQPMLLLSGVGFPRESFPGWALSIADLLPLTYAVDAMRLGWESRYFTSAGLVPTAVLLAVGGASTLIAIRVFRRKLA